MMKTTWLKKLLVGTASALALALALSSLSVGATAASNTLPPQSASAVHNMVWTPPDLVIWEAKVIYVDTVYGWYHVSFKVKNQGKWSAGPSTAMVTTMSGTVKYGSHSVPKLAGGATSGPYFDYVNPNPCGHVVCAFSAGVQADYFNKVSESKEWNNRASFK